MRQRNRIRRAMLIFGGIALVIAAAVTTIECASAQITAQVTIVCPDGYAYLEGYGCEPLSYFYGPPYYAYPNYGFFYGGPWWGWGNAWRGYGGHGFGGGGHGGGGGHR